MKSPEVEKFRSLLVSRRRRWQRMRPVVRLLIPVFVMGMMAGMLALSQLNCGKEKAELVPPRPLVPRGLPIVRVLLTPSPVEQATISTRGGYLLEVSGRVLAQSQSPLAEMTITRQNRYWKLNTLEEPGAELILNSKDANGRVCLGKTGYRGELRLIPDPENPKRFRVINVIDMESYLAGVLAKELYPSWEPEAYRALAVAARTFAMYHKLTFGAENEWDIGSNQSAQVYGGADAETPKSWQAVRSTHGWVLTCGKPGDERVFMTQYSSCCGGYVNPARVLRNAPDLPPLAGGQACEDCRNATRYRWSPVVVRKADLYLALADRYEKVKELADLKEIRVVEQTNSGRAIWVDVIDSNGKRVRLRAEDIRLSMIYAGLPEAKQLYSMNCQWRDLGNRIEFYEGRGFGHGVGLCQWGTQGKALRGQKAEQILEFYYPGAQIYRSY